jgi:ribonuclease BN (tRNA processing enzyme)
MKVVFLGVGEAFDENLANNSHLVCSEGINMLLDCGYSVPQSMWRFNGEPDFLDAIYISHQHADHYFGLPAMLLRMWEDGRKKDMTIICQKELAHFFPAFMGSAYKRIMERFRYKINLVESRDGGVVDFQDLRLSFERTSHSIDNLAVKIADGKKTIVYGGDGSPLPESSFYQGLDLLILESYMYDKEIVGHSSIVSAVSFAKSNDVKCLALTHIQRDVRRNLPEIKSGNTEVIIPEPLQEWS